VVLKSKEVRELGVVEIERKESENRRRFGVVNEKIGI
jgi:hypothetical protein